MTLESFAHLATVVTLMILVYVQAKPRRQQMGGHQVLALVSRIP